MVPVTRFLEEKLKFRVNRDKSAVRSPCRRPHREKGGGDWRAGPPVHMAMGNARLAKAGLRRLTDRYLMLRGNETAGCDIARPVV
jgi:hypothetical protein